jgi:UDP-N-acetylmuramoyl-tripeptide--D-alanyl-D-alanine ligase
MIRIEDLHKLFDQHAGISTDTRDIKRDTIFFCLKGAQFDGNLFAQQAVDAGAAFVVTDDPENVIVPRTILVDDVLSTLQELASYHRSQFQIPVIGITGTNGKTTTKELITAVLSKKYQTVSTSGNLNNHIGVPLTLLRLTSDTEMAVIEMGANHPGEIAELCKIAKPNAGLITNIGKAHLEGFGSTETILETKTALYRSVDKQGPVFVFSGHRELRKKARSLHYIIYGPGKGSKCRGKIVGAQPFISVAWGDRYENKTDTHLAGSWNLENITAAACIGRHYGIADTDIHDALALYTPSNMRSQVKETETNTVIIDAYNANPGSMTTAIAYFASLDSSRKCLILGDMLELGVHSRQEHREILKLVDHYEFAVVYWVGPEFSSIGEKSSCFPTAAALKAHLEKNPLKGYLIFLKGSRGIGLEKIIEAL